MVKALHPLGPLAGRIELAPGAGVPLEHDYQAAPSESSATWLDPEIATRQALESPLNYPPLSQSTVPGDSLAIAIDEAVPDAIAILRGSIASAVEAGIDTGSISIVATNEDFVAALRQEFGEQVSVVIHDPDDPENLCLVALNEKNERLLVNRTIFEADIVLPIGCARLESTAGSSVYNSLFPRMSDAETIGRYRTPTQRETNKRRTIARKRADEAGWLLGVPMVVQVVPGPNGAVAQVLAGDADTVFERSQEACERIWSLRAPHRASLVIATVTGGAQEQTWGNIARALTAAEPLVEEGGAVAICSDVESSIGRSLGHLLGNPDFEAVERDVRNDHSEDSWPAWQLARALQRGPVYFLSRLDSDVVEELGLAPISDIGELQRLAARHESCIVLDDSQHARVTVASEFEEEES